MATARTTGYHRRRAARTTPPPTRGVRISGSTRPTSRAVASNALNAAAGSKNTSSRTLPPAGENPHSACFPSPALILHSSNRVWSSPSTIAPLFPQPPFFFPPFPSLPPLSHPFLSMQRISGCCSCCCCRRVTGKPLPLYENRLLHPEALRGARPGGRPATPCRGRPSPRPAAAAGRDGESPWPPRRAGGLPALRPPAWPRLAASTAASSRLPPGAVGTDGVGWGGMGWDG